MLFQATVPNTYAAGLASLAAWNRVQAKPRVGQSKPTAAEASHLRCECGNTRPLHKTPYNACESCAAIERGRIEHDTGAIDQAVLALFKPGARLSVTEIVEAFHYKKARHVLGKAVFRLFRAGKLLRARADGAYADGFVYMLRDAPAVTLHWRPR